MRNFRINKEQYHPGIITSSDILFRTIFDESPDAIFLLESGSFTITDCNNQALQLFQAGNKAEFEGMDTFRLYDSEPVEFSREILINNINEGNKQVQEVAFRTVKGNVFWGCGTFRKIRTMQGSLIVFRVRRVVDYMMTAEMLSTLIKHTSRVTGTDFFNAVTELLVKNFGVGMAAIVKVDSGMSFAESLCFWPDKQENDPGSFELQSGPSHNVVKGYTTFYPSHLSEYFPADKMVRKLHVESYIGAPVYNSSGKVIALLVMMDRKPMEEIPNLRFILTILASRTGAELERLECEADMRRQISDLKAKLAQTV
jgi:PAS domain S-box-containing protein